MNNLFVKTRKAKMPTERHAMEYNLNHKNRGLAMIFNHEKFTWTEEIREGTEKDCSALEQMFKDLEFNVSIYNDCTLKELHQHIKNASKQDHTESDCIAIAILSHGEIDGHVHAKDLPYNLNDIFQRFTPKKCPTLAGKPKLFFIQACRGANSDSGMKFQTDGSGNAMSFRIPLHADFLIAYSTVPDFVSYRTASKGSFYIQALVKHFNENGTDYDILTLLTFVNQYVAFECESYMPKEPKYDNKKQMPSFTSMLTRLLRFNIKNDIVQTKQIL